jgi:hypothetical protein
MTAPDGHDLAAAFASTIATITLVRETRGLIVAVASITTAGACTFGSLDGLAGGARSPGEGGAPTDGAGAGPISETDEAGPDAADVGADVDADVDAGKNLYPLGTFEIEDCGGTGYNSKMTDDPTAHSGTHACRVCSNGAAPNPYSFDQTINDPPVAGARYYAEVWVHAAPGAPVPTSGVEVNLRTYDNPFVQREEKGSGENPLGSTWLKLSVELGVTGPADHLDVFVNAEVEDGTCFLIDDIIVRRVL